MNYLNTSVNWEEFFIQEALELEEKMKHFDQESLNKSKLLIAFENNILEWSQYEQWFCHETGCSSFKSEVELESLDHLTTPAKTALEIYSNHEIWDAQLFPLCVWDNKVYVMGLHYPAQLQSVENHVFILTPPHVLAYLAEKLFSAETNTREASSDEAFEMTGSMLDGIDLDIAAPLISFAPTANNNEKLAPPIWDFIDERHDEYSFEAKKHFNAYIVLKIVNQRTQVFKMDADLEKDGVSGKIFEYSLKQENPFNKVFLSGQSESFSLSQLGITIKSYRYACITALRRGNTVLGFLIGFKEKNLSERDQTLLEELAKESA
ncbi:MAG: hypothetical protein H7061_07925 [Bdellovibrionaceae bacterium]|nr:hypothetical protein [Bdellovibrio sp.]